MTEVTDEMVEAGARVMADLCVAGLIEAPQLPAPCWNGSVRAILESAFLFCPSQEWLDINTAPKDGEPIIYQDSDQAVSTCSWQVDDCGSSWWDIAGDQIAYPVRWMPLPPVAVTAGDRDA